MAQIGYLDNHAHPSLQAAGGAPAMGAPARMTNQVKAAPVRPTVPKPVMRGPMAR